ncbi:ribokinase [Niallia circulans]|jgi:fructoselysine 6-kinase|uniref:Carbohydrate kinase PfkB domain-containing protein n=2 Tax=Niallia circulans TaxID=1397 RepID=A0AA91Z1L8_NIACI|nr:ribokinase [Niallia circulans]PAD83585.1 hypothetical protein CHH57_08980 [Niallia circulans]
MEERRKRMKKLNSEIKVIGYGDNVVDRYINRKIMYPGGNALNFSVNAKRLGVNAAYLGEFGYDEEGQHIKAVLSELGVDISKCSNPRDAITEKADVEVIDGDRVFIGAHRGTRRPISITKEIKEYISSFSLLHSGCHAATESQLGFLNDIPVIKSFDFSDPAKYRTKEYLNKVCPHIDVALFSCADDDENEIERLYNLCNQWNVRYILMTRGADSPVFFSNKRKYTGIVKKLERVEDTMGAGDAYFTAFVVSLLSSGWTSINNELQEEQVNQAFIEASHYSSEVCKIQGSFGFPKRF